MKKTALITALAVAALSLSACASEPAAGVDDSKAAATTTAAKETAKPSDPLKAAEQAANVDGLKVSKSTAKGAPIIAQFQISEHLSSLATKLDAQDDTVKILKAVQENVPSYSKVYVQGSLPTTDAYGKESNSMVLNASYGKATVQRIDFDGIDSGSVWTIRDGGNINANILG